MVERLLAAVDEAKILLDAVRHAVRDGAPSDDVPVVITEDVSPRLFILRNDVVRVSTWQSEGIAKYVGMSVEDYLVLCALLGLVQERAIAKNTYLIEDDCAHTYPVGCLYDRAERKQDFAALLERPHVCNGCFDFYAQLGVTAELAALEMHLRDLQ